MPIFTLLSKSMPSTCSRKPCTKCWRDCSPSHTMSRPASSWALIHSRVASALAWRSASPSARHWGQSLLVSASQAGLGRLPAIEVSNIGEFLQGKKGWCQRTSGPLSQAAAQSMKNGLSVCLAGQSAQSAAHCSRTFLYGLMKCSCANLPCRSEEHTSELQSPDHLVCRLLLEKKKSKSYSLKSKTAETL